MPRLGRSRPASNYKSIVSLSSFALTRNSTASMALAPLAMSATGLVGTTSTGSVALAPLAISATMLGGNTTTTGSVALAPLAMSSTDTETYFPQVPLAASIQILINGTWNDITTLVYERNPVQITRGRPDETQNISPMQMTLTLNNRDGRFSALNPNGTYYPYIGRNTPIRVYLEVPGMNSAYAGYRFWGEISSLPVSWDASGTDIYCDITASGVCRRLQQSTATIGSSLRRYFTVSTPNPPDSYWPCEDAAGATTAGIVINNSGAGTAGVQAGDGVSFGANTDALGSDALLTINNGGSGGIGFTTGYTSAATGGTLTRTTPGTYYWDCPTGVTSVSVQCWGAGGGGGGSSSVSYGHNASGGGGGGGYAANTSVGVTPGDIYTFVVPAGGAGGTSGVSSGVTASQAYFIGDSVTVEADGGVGGYCSESHSGDGGAGGVGASGSTTYNGGNGSNGYIDSEGGGGGSSAGTGSGGTSTGTNAGGTAPSGGGNGGNGGSGGTAFGYNGSVPGGGGGGAGVTNSGNHTGGAGAAGQVTLTYSSGGSIVPINAVRFLLEMDSTPDTNGALVGRIFTTGGISAIDIWYETTAGGSIYIQGFNGATSEFTSSTLAGVNGVPIIVDIQLIANGSNVDVVFSGIEVGSVTPISTYTHTLSSYAVGVVTSINFGDTTLTEADVVGHVAYFQTNTPDPLCDISAAANGYANELALQRFKRLCTEESLSYEILTSYESVILADSPVNLWKLDEASGATTVIDYGSSGNNGTASNVTFGTVAQPNITSETCGSFNGTSSKINITGYNPSGEPVSVEAWVYVPDTAIGTGVNGRILCNGHTDVDNNGLELYLTANAIPTVSLGSGSAHSTVASPEQIYANQWNHLVGTYDGTNVLLYVNGVEVAAGTLSGGVNTGDNAFSIGYNADYNGDYFSGYIAEVAIYGTTLTPAQVLTHAMGGAMGPQPDDTLMNILQQVEDLDRGLLYECIDQLGLGYIQLTALQNQSVALTLNYTAAELADHLTPTFDDLLVRNDITVTRGTISNNTPATAAQLQSYILSASTAKTGGTYRAYLATGALSIQEPPNGVYDYAYSLTVNSQSDTQLPACASQILATGTVNDYRYPNITVDLTRTEVGSLFSTIGGLTIGELIEITNPPSFLTSTAIEQLVWGYTETLNAFVWTIVWNCVPASPYLSVTW